jgi:hypothetical protein
MSPALMAGLIRGGLSRLWIYETSSSHFDHGNIRGL